MHCNNKHLLKQLLLLPLLLLLLLQPQRLLADIDEDSEEDVEERNTQPPKWAKNFKANYIVTASRTMVIGTNYKIGVALLSDASWKSVTATLFTVNAREGFTNVTISDSRSFSRGGAAFTELQLILPISDIRKYDLAATYNLNVSIESVAGEVFTNQTEISVTRPNAVTLIQTDKGIYKPGTMIGYRVLTLDSGLKPLFTNTLVTVRDPKRNLLYSKWHNISEESGPQTSPTAVSEGSLPLSEIANFGTWRLEAVNEFGSESVNVEVSEYTLPRFTLDVTLPEFVHIDDDSFTVKAAVSYTFNKMVEGQFTAKIGPYNSCRRCKPSYDLVKEFQLPALTDAPSEFVFDLAEWRNVIANDSIRSFYHVKVDITFTEKFTGVQKSVDEKFTIYRNLYSVSVSADETKYFLPGIQIPCQVTLIRPDNKPYTEPVTDTIDIELMYTRRGKPMSMSQTAELSPSPTGTGVSLLLTVPAMADFAPISIKVKLAKSPMHSYKSVRIVPYMAFSDDYVMISSIEEKGDKKKILMERSEGIKAAYLLTVSNTQIQTWTRVEVSGDKNQILDWSDSDCSDCINSLPEVDFFMLGLTNTGELVASTLKEDLTRFAPNITITTNLTKNTAAPQEFAALQFSAKPNSFVYLSGIDHSVNLLRAGNDILRDSVLKKKIEILRHARFWRPRPSNVNIGQLLMKHNLLIMTDAGYFKESDNNRITQGSGIMMARNQMMESMKVDSAPDMQQVQSQVRKFFPETMLWSMVQTNDEGRAEYALKMPDTITSWDVTAFGLSAAAPIQTMVAPLQLVTRKDFFIRPILPSSIIRTEKFIMKVLVFNYMKGDTIYVSLRKDATFTAAVYEGQKSQETEEALIVEVSFSGSTGMAVFELEAKNLTAMQLLITGELRFTSSQDGLNVVRDIVQRQLPVVPEGITERRTTSMLISLNGTEVKQSLPINFPSEDSEDFVKGSEVLYYSAIGSVLGPAMQNLEKLVRMPSGCGEQNLVNFAPAVSVAEFARKAGLSEQSAMFEKALRAMQTGYQRQLTYRRRDGSYSAFGDRDPTGSVWLTAFTLSTLARTAKFVPVDPEAVTGMSVKYLLDIQGPNGEFKEPPGGKVFDSGLQGEADTGSVGMTAFVCAALMDIKREVDLMPKLETRIWKAADISGALQKCFWNLKEAVDSELDSLDSFDTAMSTYTLTLAKSQQMMWVESLESPLEQLRARLTELAVTGPNSGRYWKTKTSWGSPRESIEATSYALMVSVLNKQQEESLTILRWLTSKQTDIGGFGSTQATVTALRSLTLFSETFAINANPNSIATVSVGTANNDSLWDSMTFKADNRWVLRQALVGRGDDARVTSLLAEATGTGTALLTVTMQYNIRDPVGNPKQLGTEWIVHSGLGLRLDESNVRPIEPASVRLTVCVRANVSDSSGMHILTITNPSGHSVGQYSEFTQVRGLMRVEPKSDKVVFYFSEIAEKLCVFANWQRNVAVLNTEPQVVTLQKYYKPEEKVVAFHNSPDLQLLTKCKACPDCPNCEVQNMEAK